jgi:hypothetical protein
MHALIVQMYKPNMSYYIFILLHSLLTIYHTLCYHTLLLHTQEGEVLLSAEHALANTK